MTRTAPLPIAQVSHPADLVGRGVAYEEAGGAARHGTIVKASYRLAGETGLVVHPDCRPSEVAADAVLMGRPATTALSHLDSIDETARRRLSAEQAQSLPEIGPSGRTAPSSGW